MNKGQRLVIFLGSLALLVVVVVLRWSNLIQLPDTPRIILITSLVMLSFITLCLEHFFTKPTDVLASTLSIILLLTPLHSQLDKMGVWYCIFLGYSYVLMLAALASLFLLADSKPTDAPQNRIAGGLKEFAVRFGAGRFLFFGLFAISMLAYVDSQSTDFLVLFGYATALLLINPKAAVFNTARLLRSSDADIGTIFGVQSKNTFLIRLHPTHKPVRRYGCVEFTYSMDDRHRVFRGLILDNYLLNEQQWIKVLTNPRITEALEAAPECAQHKPNHVYNLEVAERPEILSRFVGVILEDSKIQAIRFEYSHVVPLSEGDLLEVDAQQKRILYQVVQGVTDTEALEAKNETGLIVGEAVQLGVWNQASRSFERFGWVPDINTPVFLASNITEPALEAHEMQVGHVPGTNYPVTVNLQHAVTHHLAILGVTGSGKSVFARDLIRKVVGEDIKVICVDFTQEYAGKFTDLDIKSIANEEEQEKLFTAIDAVAAEQCKFKNQQKAEVIEQGEKEIGNTFYTAMKRFLEDPEHSIALFELPDVTNTTGILDYTKWFFKALFFIARKHANFGKRLCIVLEEAHTVVPEWNFIGVAERDAQSLVNSIGQIALQGRKYGVGFIVIAQRTANVSKTILTQCNSIIAFQQFDKTSSEFLANYMGPEMVDVLPNLRQRQAIGVGKAFTSKIPIIFHVPEIQE